MSSTKKTKLFWPIRGLDTSVILKWLEEKYECVAATLQLIWSGCRT